MMNVAKELAEEHYVDLSSKPFYPGLVNYIIRWGAWAAAHAAIGAADALCSPLTCMQKTKSLVTAYRAQKRR